MSRSISAIILIVVHAAGASGQDDELARARTLLRSDRVTPEAREVAARLVAEDGREARGMAAELARAASHGRRLNAVALLMRLGPEAVLETAVRGHALHRDSTWSVRRDVMRALQGSDARTIEVEVTGALDDPIWSVRRAAVQVAAHSPVPWSGTLEASVRARLFDPDPAVADAAAWAVLSRDLVSSETVAAMGRVFEDGRRSLRLVRAIWLRYESLPLAADAPRLPRGRDGLRALRSSPVDEAVTLLRDFEVRRVAGDEIVARMIDRLANDTALDAVLLSATPAGPERELLRTALDAPSPDHGVPAVRRSALTDVLADRPTLETGLRVAARALTPQAVRRLERIVLDAARADREVDEERARLVHRAYTLVARAGRSDPGDFLAACRRHRIVAIRSDALARSWRAGSRDVKRLVLAEVERLFDRQTLLAIAVAREIGRSPDPLAMELFLNMVKRGGLGRVRVAGVEGMIKLDSPRARKTLWRIAQESDASPGVIEARRHLVRVGHEGAVAFALDQLATRPRLTGDVLATADLVESPRVADILRRRLADERTALGSRTLSQVVDVLARRIPRAELVELLRPILVPGDAAPTRHDLRAVTIEHLLTRHRLVELRDAVLEAAEAGRIGGDLDGVYAAAVALAGDDAARRAVVRRLHGIASRLRGDDVRPLLAPLAASGLPQGLDLVRERAEDALLRWLAAGDPWARDDAGETLGVAVVALVQSGVERGIDAALALLHDVDRRRRGAVLAGDRRGAAQWLEIEELMVAALDGARHYTVLERALIRTAPRVHHDVIAAWAGRRYRSRHDATPCEALARAILAEPVALRRVPMPVLASLGVRLLARDDDRVDGLALELLTIARRHGFRRPKSADSPARFTRQILAVPLEGRALHWHILRARQRRAATDVDPTRHPRHLEGLLELAWELEADGRLDAASALVDSAVPWAGLEPAVGPARCRLLLARGELDAARETAHRLGRSTTGRQRRTYGVLEARALWGAGRHDEAVRLLRQRGVRPGDGDVRRAQFPGIEETAWYRTGR